MNTNIASCIEYTNLQMNLSSKDIREVVNTAITQKYRSIVLTHNNVAVARDIIKRAGAITKVVTVFGFPSDGYNLDVLKRVTAFYDELDILVPIAPYYMSTPSRLIYVRGVLSAVQAQLGVKKKCKFIIETALMKDKENQIKELCAIASTFGISVIKTNSGLYKRKKEKEHLEDISLIKKYWKGDIKASGGIATLEYAQELVEAGATYIGTSKNLMEGYHA